MRVSSKKRLLRVFTAALFAVVTVAASFLPLLAEIAAADPKGATNINMYKKGLSGEENGYFDSVPYATCKVKFTNILKTTQFLEDQVSSEIAKIPGYPNPTRDQVRQGLSSIRTPGRLETKIGTFSRNNSGDVDRMLYILSGVGSARMPMLQFYSTDDLATKPINSGRPSVPDNGGICDPLVAIPVSQTEWRGHQRFDPSSAGTFPRHMTFTLSSASSSSANATGSLKYESPHEGTSTAIHGVSDRTDTIQVDGKPDFNQSGGVSVGSIYAQWVDASTIKMPNTTGSGKFGNDVYKKYTWGGDNADKTAYYFLDSAGDNSRSAIAWGSGRGCERPLPEGSNCNGNNEANCVPFIAVKQLLDFSTEDANKGLPRLKNDINQLPTAHATLYDYDPKDCRLIARLSIPSFHNAQNAKVWFYYSKQQDAFRPVWQSGGGNETTYLTSYTLKNGVYLGGDTTCNASLKITETPAPRGDSDPMYGVAWSLYDRSCQSLYGTIPVYAIGGAAGEAGYTGTTGSTNNNIPVVKEPRIGCDFFTANALNWLVCPLIKGATNLVAMFDDAISKKLDVDVKPIFDDKTETGRAYHTAWGVFRVFALGLIAIAALIMVISQAAGLEMLDPYIIKKVMPRLLLAAVGITFSWELTELAVTISNDLGNGIRSIIYAPFGAVDGIGQLGNGAKFVTLLLTTGAILAYGWFAMLSLVLTAALAMFIAFALLAFREILIIFLVMIAPIAIACSILPNTEKAWNMWKTTFIGALMVFVIFSAFVATGHVFSATAAANDGTLEQLIAIIAYFAPYFLIPLIFRLAGGVIATIGGIVNDRGRGAFDRLKNYRANKLQQNFQDMQTGERFNGNNPFSKGFNTMTRGVSTFANAKSKYGFLTDKNVRDSAFQLQGAIDAARFAKSDHGQAIQHNDPVLQALTFDSAASARAGLAQRFKAFRNADGSANTSAIEQAIAGAEASGGFSRQRQTYAAQQLFATGTGYDDIHEAHKAVHGVAGDNANVAAAILGYGNSATKGVGRYDLAPGYGTHMKLYQSMRQKGSLSEDEIRSAYMDALKGVDAVSALRGKPTEVKNLMGALQQSLVQAQQTAETATGQEKAEAEIEVGRLTGIIENYINSGMYAAPINIQHTTEIAARPTSGQAQLNADGTITPPPRYGNRQRAKEQATVVAQVQDPRTGQMVEVPLNPNVRAGLDEQSSSARMRQNVDTPDAPFRENL